MYISIVCCTLYIYNRLKLLSRPRSRENVDMTQNELPAFSTNKQRQHHACYTRKRKQFTFYLRRGSYLDIFMRTIENKSRIISTPLVCNALYTNANHIHPSIHLLSPLNPQSGRRVLEPVQAILGRRSRQFIAGT